MARPEITGRGAKKRRPRGPAFRAAPPPRGCYSIEEFCNAHGFRPTFFYTTLKEKGIAPATIKLGRRVLITVEEAERWRREREAAAATAAEIETADPRHRRRAIGKENTQAM